MEAARQGKSLLESVRPPRLEDAGLEDCALPPEAITEAFLKAAASVRSAFNGRDCVDDPGPSDVDLQDSLVGDDTALPCGGAGEKGGLPEACGDKVVGSGDEKCSSDRLLGVEVSEKGRGRACVDGLLEEMGKEEEEGFERNEEEEEDHPILAEACI